MKRFFSSALLLVLLSIPLCAAPAAKKPWTFLVYLAGVNNLNEFAYADLAEMMKVGSNENVNVLVFFNVLLDNGSSSATQLYIEKNRAVQITAPYTANSGNINTLKKALAWALVDYPSDNIAVVLWDHGSGVLNKSQVLNIRGICYDDVYNSYLTDRNVLDAFTWAQNTHRKGKKFDIIACDACLMAMVEMAYTLSNCTSYFVASQETIPGDGYEYARILNFFASGIPNPKSLAQSMIAAYQAEYVGTPDYTLSAMDSSKVPTLVDSVNQLATFISTVLKGRKANAMRTYLAKSYSKTITFNNGIYCDMTTFLTALKSFIPKIGLTKADATKLESLIGAVNTALKQAVIAKVASTSYKNTGGLSFYFPPYEIDSSYYNLHWTEKNPYMLQLLESYLQ